MMSDKEIMDLRRQLEAGEALAKAAKAEGKRPDVDRKNVNRRKWENKRRG